MARDFARLLESRYGTGPGFTAAYLGYFESGDGRKIETERDLDALDATRRMWFEYAMSTNQRGVALVREVARYRKLAGARYLDIGCGFGGSLVAAAQAGAGACLGIEPDGLRAGFARKNLQDFGLDAAVSDLDALTPGIAQRLGRFDVITCNDVAEHVESPEQLIANLRSLLSPGGVAYLEIPNGGSIEFVASDGHFGLFGITLLDREEAKKYHGEWFRFEYDVGHYLSLEQHLGLFAAAGLSVELVESLHHPTRAIGELDAQLENLERKRRADSRLDLPYERYRERLAADRNRLSERAFRDRYLRAFWTFVARPATPWRRLKQFARKRF